jgi:hypothetical protein
MRSPPRVRHDAPTERRAYGGCRARYRTGTERQRKVGGDRFRHLVRKTPSKSLAISRGNRMSGRIFTPEERESAKRHRRDARRGMAEKASATVDQLLSNIFTYDRRSSWHRDDTAGTPVKIIPHIHHRFEARAYLDLLASFRRRTVPKEGNLRSVPCLPALAQNDASQVG